MAANRSSLRLHEVVASDGRQPFSVVPAAEKFGFGFRGFGFRVCYLGLRGLRLEMLKPHHFAKATDLMLDARHTKGLLQGTNASSKLLRRSPTTLTPQDLQRRNPPTTLNPKPCTLSLPKP